MKTPITIYVEVEDVVKFRELLLNPQEICRKAIRKAINNKELPSRFAEIEKEKSEVPRR